MKWRWMAISLLVTGGAAAWAANSQPVRSIDGGGAAASAAGYQLSGVIGGLATPGGSGSNATSYYQIIEQGFLACALAEQPIKNAADPAWLLLDDAAGPLAPATLRSNACHSPFRARHDGPPIHQWVQ